MSQALCEASCKKYRCFLRKKCEGGKSRNMMHEKWMYWMVAMQNHLLQSLKLEIQNHSIIRNSRMWLLQSGSYRCTAGRRATGLVKASLRTQLGLDIFNLKMEKKIKDKPGCSAKCNKSENLSNKTQVIKVFERWMTHLLFSDVSTVCSWKNRFSWVCLCITVSGTCTRVRTTSKGAQAVTATARPTPPARRGAQMPHE